MNIDEQNDQRLHTALLEAFPTQAELAQVVRFGLKQNLAVITAPGTLSSVVFDLIQWSRAHGKFEELLIATFAANSANDRLRAIIIESGLAPNGDIYQFLRDLEAAGLVPPKPAPAVRWGDFRAACMALSHIALEKMKGKDTAKSFVPRVTAQQDIQKFLQSDSTFLVIVGESGMGKTDLLRNLTTHLAIQADTAFLVYDAPTLDTNRDESLFDRVERDLRRYLRFSGQNLLELVEKEGVVSGQTVVITIDAVNESCDPLGLVQRIDSILTYNFKFVKILLTCRPHVWQQARRKYITHSRYYSPDGQRTYIDLGHFTPAEATEAYQKYKEEYHFAGPAFADLPERLQEQLSDPLFLRLLAEMSENKSLPAEISSLDINLVPRYVEHLMSEDRLGGKDIALLTQQINPLLISQQRCNGATTREEILRASNELSTTRRLENLLDAGLLLETGSRSEADADAMIRYRYERFQDYYLGQFVYDNSAKDERK